MTTRLYADDVWRRTRQVAGDVAVVAVVWLALRWAGRLRDAIRELGVAAEGLDRSGRTVTGAADRARDAVDGLPVVGDALAAPFRTLGGAGGDLVAAGDQVARTVEGAAVWIPTVLLVALLAWLGLKLLPARVRWVREASDVARLVTTEDDAARLLGTRAAATRPLRQLRRQVGDPAAALAAGRYAALAAVELRALGLDPRRLTDVTSAADAPARPAP